MRALSAALAMLALAGCISIGGDGAGVPHALYRLHDAAQAPTTLRTETLVAALLIQPLPADALADTASIAYSRSPDQFAFYQLASWTERPVRQLPRLLQQRLQSRGVAGAVGVMGDPLRADWLLTVGLDTLHHDVSAPPGQVRLALTVELFDQRSRKSVARQRFEAGVPAPSADSAAAAASMSQAVAQVFDRLVPWLEAELQRASAQTAP